MRAFVFNLRSVASHERRHKNNPELAGIIDSAANEIERLQAALRDAHGLIDNDLVVPWIMAHKLDDVLGIKSKES